MAFGVEAVNGSAGGAGNRTVAGFVVTDANLLLLAVTVGLSAADPLTGIGSGAGDVSYGAQNFTAIAGSDSDDNNFIGVRWYRLNNPTPGTATITVVDGGWTLAAIHAISFIDADVAGTPLGTPSVNTATSTNPNVTVADSASGNIVVSAMATDGSTTATTEAGTLIFESENNQSDVDHSAQYQTASGANTACTWTNATSDGWAASGVAVKGTGGVAAVSAIPIIDYYYRMVGAKS